jgi:hypothetical protein
MAKSKPLQIAIGVTAANLHSRFRQVTRGVQRNALRAFMNFLKSWD